MINPDPTKYEEVDGKLQRIGRKRTKKAFSKPSMTEKSHKKACNINTIMSKAYKTGMVPSNTHPGMYGDFTNAEDYHTSVNRVMDAQDEFMSLPSNIRRRFSNDPAKLLDFIAEEGNRDEAIQLGLIPKPVEPEPEKLENLEKLEKPAEE